MPCLSSRMDEYIENQATISTNAQLKTQFVFIDASPTFNNVGFAAALSAS
ncbi:hypothetical protein ABW21_db0209510 [Orbilia brochopaga]|nr:hypothetical protein ABW21_db0209510 [Drechslerella brochopaga]